jgi:hypothetical protein
MSAEAAGVLISPFYPTKTLLTPLAAAILKIVWIATSL